MVKNMTYGFSIIENRRAVNEMHNLTTALKFIDEEIKMKYSLLQLLEKYDAPGESIQKIQKTLARNKIYKKSIREKFDAMWSEWLEFGEMSDAPQHPHQSIIDNAEEIAYTQLNAKSGICLANIWKNILARTHFTHTK